MEAGSDHIERWICPNDRQLALRGRLETGWSTFAENLYKRSHGTTISEDEQSKIISILQQAQEMEDREQERIGFLVEKVNQLKSNIIGNGETSCLVCGVKKGPLKPCIKCSRGVCVKCNMESTDACGSKRIFCVICWEERELLKKSGAWFLKSMPVYITPEERLARMKERGYDTSEPYLNTLNPRASLTPTIRRPSFFTEEEDFSDETSEESEDDISSKIDSVSMIYQDTTDGFDLGIDCTEVQQDIRNSFTPPEIRLVPETPNTKSGSFSFDAVDGEESGDSMSPQIRPRVSSNLSEGKRKLALKFRKKKQEAKVDNQKEDSPSPHRKEEDIDEIFKSYEEEHARNLSNSRSDSCGPLGSLEFTVQYDSNTLELLVIVHCGKGLKAMDHGVSSDPYVKTHLLPGASKSTKKRTQTVQKDVNPVFNETLVYHGISHKEVTQKILRLSVMDENKLSSNAFIGETCVSLKSLINRPVQRFKKLLEPKSEVHSYEELVDVDENPGRIEVALHYLSKKQALVVGIIQCAGLKAMDPSGYSDPYVKCYLLPDPKKKTKRKTAIKKRNLNPVFEEEFRYSIKHSELAGKTLCITVWDHDVGTRNDFIGSLCFGTKASGDALKHWYETMTTSDRRVTRWHTLSYFVPSGMEDDE